ncbi:MAG: hypothetical protein JKY25_07600 [Robiginitomaculum sp.]|nr:hypothetical protein [Robiginitomaculum sp.]
MQKTLLITIGMSGLLGGCIVAKTTGKVAALPFKTAYKTGELATKGVYYTAKGTGTVAYKTGMFAGKGVYYTGKGTYAVANVPVKVTNAALDTNIKALTVTTQVVNLSGKVVTVSRTMQRSEVDAYINQARGAANIVSILVDVFRG